MKLLLSALVVIILLSGCKQDKPKEFTRIDVYLEDDNARGGKYKTEWESCCHISEDTLIVVHVKRIERKIVRIAESDNCLTVIESEIEINGRVEPVGGQR